MLGLRLAKWHTVHGRPTTGGAASARRLCRAPKAEAMADADAAAWPAGASGSEEGAERLLHLLADAHAHPQANMRGGLRKRHLRMLCCCGDAGSHLISRQTSSADRSRRRPLLRQHPFSAQPLSLHTLYMPNRSSTWTICNASRRCASPALLRWAWPPASTGQASSGSRPWRVRGPPLSG